MTARPTSPIGPQPWLKVCGLRHPEQASAVAALGVDAIGVIGVEASPRWLSPGARPALFAAMRQASSRCLGVLVVADPSDGELSQLGAAGGHQVLQLHGQETPERCRQLREALGPDLFLWKALRIRQPEDLQRSADYGAVVDALLLDAWVPDQLGGTGHRIPIDWLSGFCSPLPWWLAGGLNPDRVAPALRALQHRPPSGLDVSSGVERAPGDKDLAKVQQLVAAVAPFRQDLSS
ncbi:MAG: phosphoribosylanthranilate isomerase [Cyanobacteria bacterium]|nr:phosphoribosylanthranilate isomerase [Cyanobacteriota bacterium]